MNQFIFVSRKRILDLKKRLQIKKHQTKKHQRRKHRRKKHQDQNKNLAQIKQSNGLSVELFVKLLLMLMLSIRMVIFLSLTDLRYMARAIDSNVYFKGENKFHLYIFGCFCWFILCFRCIVTDLLSKISKDMMISFWKENCQNHKCPSGIH